MPSLPLKVQVGIRDHWTKDDSSVQKTLKSLQGLLGLEVDVNPEWQLLLAELDKFYPEKGAFAAAVAGIVETWSKGMIELLDDESNEEWTEALLEKLKSSYSRLRLFLEVSKDEQASTSWAEDRGGFIINLPKRQLSHPPELFPLLKGEIIDCFKEKKAIAHHTAPADDWADVGVDTRTGKLDVVEKSSSAPTVDFLPDPNTLPRPDELLLKPPYHLSVYSRGPTEVEVQCSHSPTLQLLSEYLKRWCRVNHQLSTKPPTVEIKLHQCAFGLGAMYDRLTLFAENRYGGHTLSPMIVLSVVEGVLGYQKVYSDGGTWTYRRDIEFKKL